MYLNFFYHQENPSFSYLTWTTCQQNKLTKYDKLLIFYLVNLHKNKCKYSKYSKMYFKQSKQTEVLQVLQAR